MSGSGSGIGITISGGEFYTISENIIKKTGTGMLLIGGGHHAISENKISSCSYAINLTSSTTENDIISNYFYDNSQNDIYIESGCTLNLMYLNEFFRTNKVY